MKGRPARAYAAVVMGELSVLIVVPIDMKNLVVLVYVEPSHVSMNIVPKRRGRTKHVLT